MFALLLLNVPVNNYGNVGTATYFFVGLLPDIGKNSTSRPAIKHGPRQQWLRHTTYPPSKRLTRTSSMSKSVHSSAREAPCSLFISQSPNDPMFLFLFGLSQNYRLCFFLFFSMSRSTFIKCDDFDVMVDFVLNLIKL